jgi:hypothetical protein
MARRFTQLIAVANPLLTDQVYSRIGETPGGEANLPKRNAIASKELDARFVRLK